MFGLVGRVVRNPAQAEEVTQEVFVELWRTASRFDPARGRPGPDHDLRPPGCRPGPLGRAGGQADDLAGRRDQGRPYDQVAEQVEATLEREQVRRSLDALTDLQREAVVLAYYGGYTHREISELLGVPSGTVKTRLRNGLPGSGTIWRCTGDRRPAPADRGLRRRRAHRRRAAGLRAPPGRLPALRRRGAPAASGCGPAGRGRGHLAPGGPVGPGCGPRWRPSTSRRWPGGSGGGFLSLLAAAAALLVVAFSVTALGRGLRVDLAARSGSPTRWRPCWPPRRPAGRRPGRRGRAGGGGALRQRGGGVFVASGLAPAPAARTYQLWVVDRSGRGRPGWSRCPRVGGPPGCWRGGWPGASRSP